MLTEQKCAMKFIELYTGWCAFLDVLYFDNKFCIKVWFSPVWVRKHMWQQRWKVLYLVLQRMLMKTSIWGVKAIVMVKFMEILLVFLFLFLFPDVGWVWGCHKLVGLSGLSERHPPLYFAMNTMGCLWKASQKMSNRIQMMKTHWSTFFLWFEVTLKFVRIV